MIFADRADAGRQLAARLRHLKKESPIVLALPRGGVEVAAEVASELDADLDLVLVRKIGAPQQSELALGALVDGTPPDIVWNRRIVDLCRPTQDYLGRAIEAEKREIERRRAAYLGARSPIDLTGRTAIVVDDGIATGATMAAALRALRRRKPAKLVMAVPVADAGSLADLAPQADEVVCLSAPDSIGAVGAYYGDFRQLEDRDVTALLERAAKRH